MEHDSLAAGVCLLVKHSELDLIAGLPISPGAILNLEGAEITLFGGREVSANHGDYIGIDARVSSPGTLCENLPLCKKRLHDLRMSVARSSVRLSTSAMI